MRGRTGRKDDSIRERRSQPCQPNITQCVFEDKATCKHVQQNFGIVYSEMFTNWKLHYMKKIFFLRNEFPFLSQLHVLLLLLWRSLYSEFRYSEVPLYHYTAKVSPTSFSMLLLEMVDKRSIFLVFPLGHYTMDIPCASED